MYANAWGKRAGYVRVRASRSQLHTILGTRADMHPMALLKGLVKLTDAFRLKNSESFRASLKAARRSCGCEADGCNRARGEDVIVGS